MQRMMIFFMLMAQITAASFAELSPVQTQRPSFEVASIKPNNSGNGQVAIQTPPGRFRAIAVTAKLLIANAYGIRDPQISGGPPWIATDRFDIEATVKSDVQLQPSQIPLLLQDLLMDRLQLKVHHETQELPVFELTVAKGGPKLETAPEPVRPTPGERQPSSSPTNVPPGPRPGGFTQGFGQ